MHEPTLDTLTRRLDRLERENRRLRRIGLLALLAVTSIALMGQLSGAPLIEAQSFYVRDGSRGVRATLGADGLSIMDAAGKTRASLGMHGDAPALSLRDGEGKVIWKTP